MRDRADRRRRPDADGAAPAREERRREEPANPLAAVQQAAGNAAVVALVGAQAKLQVGAVNDPAEAEADRVADQVLRNLSAGPIDEKRQGAARMVNRKAAPSAAAAAPGHGLEGGEALPETTAAIDQARGSGSAMDPTTLGRMESAFGADLSDVRIHTDGQAADLSRDLNAKAFTTGKDVFFGAGQYQPGTRSGDEVLAHELTHTIQQRATAPADGAQRIHRLTLRGTDWAATETFSVSAGGANGVGFLDDGNGGLVLKSGEDFPEETTIASNVMNDNIAGTSAAPKKKKDKKNAAWTLSTPEARALDPDEEAVVKKRLNEILATREPTDRERKFVDRIGAGGATIAFTKVSGKDFSDVIAEQAATKGKGKKQKLDPMSVLGQLFTNPAMMTMLGRAGAFDVFIGNGDRLTQYFNTQNFMVDPKTNSITLVDNAAMADTAAFTTNEIVGRSGTFMLEAEAGFQAWLLNNQSFCKGDFQAMGDRLLGKMEGEFDLPGSVRAEDKAVVMKEIRARKGEMATWFANGLADGKNRLLLGLNDPLKMVAGVSDAKKEEALTSVYARKFALNGVTSAAACWGMAKSNAQRVLASQGKRADAPDADAVADSGPKWVDNPLAQPRWNANPLYSGSR